MPPKLHQLVLLGKRVDIILAGKKKGRNIFRFMKLEESMAGEDSELTGTFSELAETNFTIQKIKF